MGVGAMADRDPQNTDVHPDMRPEVQEAFGQQAQAWDPSRHRLVSANAGSGKTYVLVNRVSRLLLAGVAPEKILCLTYTKAAAAEMQERLFAQLGQWSVMDDARLHGELEKLMGGEAPSLPTARGLFAKALETPEGLKVQTIHAFCAQVLGKFPMEAGILPGFEQIDEASQDSLRDDVRKQLLHEAWYDPRSEFARELSVHSKDTANQTLDELFAWMGGNTRGIRLFATEAGLQRLADVLGVGLETDADALVRQAWRNTPVAELRRVLNPLLDSSTRDQQLADRIQTALEASARCELEAWNRYMDVFHTGGNWRASVVTKGGPDEAKALLGHKEAADTEEALRVQEAARAIKAARHFTESRRVAALAVKYAENYTRAKRARRVIDFDDQIDRVHALLTRSEASDWVRYKLDGGIGHILVDEAQDTSDLQWGIIDALKAEFPEPSPEMPTVEKTFFAVGDEKQSIYGFQGAKPASFIARVRAATEDSRVQMGLSFRSAPEVLEAVDAVFSTHTAGERMFGEGLSGNVPHIARRTDRGRVELWPIVPNPEEGEEEIAWKPVPVDSMSEGHPKEVLARRIAETVKGWIDRGEPVFDRDLKNPDGSRGRTRPMEAGDIYILVQTRDDFFDACIRHLKTIGVPVAGADRLKLADSVVVKDLVALAKWALFPGDDLSLAEVLKSPLIGFDDDALFRTARMGDGYRAKGEWLWQRLVGSGHPDDAAAVATLGPIMASVQELAPYEFFVRALDREHGGMTLRRRIEGRLGAESRDPLNEFLGQVLAFQRQTSASLQHFVDAWDSNTTEIKREPTPGRGGEVRIMTVHASKGLQAPVVILPQTTKKPKGLKGGQMMVTDDGLFMPVPKKADVPPGLQGAYDALVAANAQESLRLLYVAMTRAESRLVVCGYPERKSTKDPKKYAGEGSWYREVEAGLNHLDCELVESPWGEIKVYGGDAEPCGAADAPAKAEAPALPAWVAELAAEERRADKRVTPSHLLSDRGPAAVRSPLSRTDRAERERRFLRGNVIHRLLERLPDVPEGLREDVLERTLSTLRMSDAMKARIKEEVFGVMEGFPEIFAPGSRAEVSLAGVGAGLPDDLLLNAQIDRLAVTPERVFIVDYKSNRPPPDTQDAVSAQYMAQMAAYRELAREIWPDREVVCALLWTDSAVLMELEGARLDAALEAVQERLSTS